MGKIIDALDILGRAWPAIDCARMAADQLLDGEPISVVNSYAGGQGGDRHP